MPYEIALDRDMERGLDRYTVTVGGDCRVADAHALGDWLGAAAQNPTATFTVDLTRAEEDAASALRERTAWLRARGRVELADERAARPARAAA